MPGSRYYRTLGLSDGASQTDVRKAYRRLVMKYHPDKNSAPGAEKKFIEITEAYEILTGKKKEPAQKVSKSAKNTEEEKEQRVKDAQKRYEEQLYREYLENEIYFRKLTKGRKWKVMRLSAILGTTLSLLILIDYFLPHHYVEDRITKYSLNEAHGELGRQLSVVETAKGDRYWISNISYTLYGRAPNIYVEKSWIFHNPVRLVARGKTYYRYYDIHFNFFRHSWFLIVLFLLPLFTIIYKRKTISFSFLYHFCYYGINTLMLLYILTGERWAHLITLGFI